MFRPRADRDPRRGSVTVWLVISLAVIVAVVAIGIDGGRMMEERRRTQAAADAAALAAAVSLYENYVQGAGTDPADKAKDAALKAAADNGYPNDGTNSVVTVTVRPQSGAFAGQADYAEVVVQSNVRGSFSAAFTSGAFPVRARAVARGRPKKIGVIVLESSAAGAFSQTGTGRIEVSGSVVIDSTSPAAFNQGGSGAATADVFMIAGGYTNIGTVTGEIRTGVEPAPDPLRTFPQPDPALYPVQQYNRYALSSGQYTLQPGVYRGGIGISNQANVTFLPGVYVLDGGGIQVSGPATVAGDGVMFFNTGAAAGPVQFRGSGPVNLTAPTSGTYQGISIFQDRAVDQPVEISGNGNVYLGGLVYAPAAAAKLTGNGALGTDLLGGAVICRTMQVSGDGGFKIGLGSNRPRVPDVGLVE